MERKRKIVIENGQEFHGIGFGANCDSLNELVFNTSMAGYQEIISNPSCAGQTVVMTYPVIGNYGITDEDFESKTPTIGGLIVREYNDSPSNFRYTKTLSEILEENQIPGISEIDTRMLTRIIREQICNKVLITDAATPTEIALQKLKAYTNPTDMVNLVSCKKKWYSRTANHTYNVVAVDCGIKHNIIRVLNQKGCNVTVVPYKIKAEEILDLSPDGLIISNGPGNPEDVPPVINLIKNLMSKLPIFGIGLGHQLIALACGAKTYKMKLGHRGSYPVLNIDTEKIEITAQGHSYAVDMNSVRKTCLRVTHVNILDDTAEGIESMENKLYSVQYYPESAPGPRDSAYVFDKFIDMMEK